ncbi:MAG: hypothetical protein KJ622_08800 [Alphaproteobacteria bacterium]|nr:hypothetical protein [Alphaproteobacteria bacterium]
MPTILQTILRYYVSFDTVVCVADEAALRIEMPVRGWALRDGALKPGQKVLFIANRDRNIGLMLRPEYLAYLDRHSAGRLWRLLEGTRNARLSSEVLNSWVDIVADDQAIAS